MEKVRCSECGFLASRNVHSRQLEETEQRTRDKGYVDTGCREAPICLAGASDLWADSGITAQTVCYGNVDGIRLAIQKERECKEFVEWQQGFTPKEHREMIDWERERRWHSIELIVFVVVTLLAGIGGAIVGALIARGTI
jgi:hypothetical protein